MNIIMAMHNTELRNKKMFSPTLNINKNIIKFFYIFNSNIRLNTSIFLTLFLVYLKLEE